MCLCKRVMATCSQASRQTRPRTHADKFTSFVFSHTSVHTLQLAASVCKKPDEVRLCVDLVTLQCGRVFETAPQREVVTGWENAWNEDLIIDYLFAFCFVWFCTVYFDCWKVLTTNLTYWFCQVHSLCQDLPVGECRKCVSGCEWLGKYLCSWTINFKVVSIDSLVSAHITQAAVERD